MLNTEIKTFRVVHATDIDQFITDKFGLEYNVIAQEELYEHPMSITIDDGPLSDYEREQVEEWKNSGDMFSAPGVSILLGYLRDTDGSVLIGDYLIEVW